MCLNRSKLLNPHRGRRTLWSGRHANRDEACRLLPLIHFSKGNIPISYIFHPFAFLFPFVEYFSRLSAAQILQWPTQVWCRSLLVYLLQTAEWLCGSQSFSKSSTAVSWSVAASICNSKKERLPWSNPIADMHRGIAETLCEDSRNVIPGGEMGERRDGWKKDEVGVRERGEREREPRWVGRAQHEAQSACTAENDS